MPRQRERVMLLQRPAPPGKNGSGLTAIELARFTRLNNDFTEAQRRCWIYSAHTATPSSSAS